MFKIPEGVFESYQKAADEFILNSNIGVDCKLIYPPKRVACDNCEGFRGNAAPAFRNGGVGTGFSCHQCQNSGFKEVEQTENIRLRAYWNQKDWKKVGPQIQVPDAEVMIIGFLSQLNLLLKASKIKLATHLEGEYNWDFALASEPFPHGFGKKRYFIGYLKRA
jgi:hypothetical protein